MESGLSYATQYPLFRSGALFVIVVGTAMVLGAIWFRARNMLLVLGAIIAVIATSLCATRLAAPYGMPTISQVTWLAIAVLAEVLALMFLVRRIAPRGERVMLAAVLAIVGLHFLPMAPAFGPLIAVLGVACTANALVAVRLPNYALRAVWAVDGGLKVLLGVLIWSVTSMR